MRSDENHDAAEARTGARSIARALPDSGRLIVESVLSTDSDTDHQAVDPVIARFRAALKRVQTSELERLYRRLPELDERSRRVIWQFADCLVAGMLEPPLECLRDETRWPPAQTLGRPAAALSAVRLVSLRRASEMPDVKLHVGHCWLSPQQFRFRAPERSIVQALATQHARQNRCLVKRG